MSDDVAPTVQADSTDKVARMEMNGAVVDLHDGKIEKAEDQVSLGPFAFVHSSGKTEEQTREIADRYRAQGFDVTVVAPLPTPKPIDLDF